MTLLEVYEPLFEYVCVLNRLRRAGDVQSITYDSLKAKILSLLEIVKKRAEQEPLVALQAAKLEQPILFFVDSMMAESQLPLAPQWHQNRLAFGQDQLAGDEKFFDLLDETLADASADATERLKVYYVCLGLGFVGWYASQPEYLRKKMETIARRINVAQDRERLARLCPEAYQYLDTRNLIEPPAGKIGAIVALFLLLAALVAAVNFYLFRLGSEGLAQSLQEILRHDLGR